MKFIITRTSLRNDEEKPCEEAHQEPVLKYTDSTISKPELIQKYKWMQGKKYKKVGRYLRFYENEPTDVWVIEIKTLEELVKFYKKYGWLVFTETFTEDIPLEIEIYDDYRE